MAENDEDEMTPLGASFKELDAISKKWQEDIVFCNQYNSNLRMNEALTRYNELTFHEKVEFLRIILKKP